MYSGIVLMCCVFLTSEIVFEIYKVRSDLFAKYSLRTRADEIPLMCTSDLKSDHNDLPYFFPAQSATGLCTFFLAQFLLTTLSWVRHSCICCTLSEQ